MDINECVRGTSGCAITGAACTNSAGGYTCACTLGYAGDGFSCNPTPTLDQLQLNYTTQGAAQLACDEGQDVKYPTGVPGFAYDPTGGLSRADGASDAMVGQGGFLFVGKCIFEGCGPRAACWGSVCWGEVDTIGVMGLSLCHASSHKAGPVLITTGAFSSPCQKLLPARLHTLKQSNL